MVLDSIFSLDPREVTNQSKDITEYYAKSRKALLGGRRGGEIGNQGSAHTGYYKKGTEERE